jgi:hypothetical protein
MPRLLFIHLTHGGDGEDMDIVLDIVRHLEYHVGLLPRIAAAHGAVGAAEDNARDPTRVLPLVVVQDDHVRLFQILFQAVQHRPRLGILGRMGVLRFLDDLPRQLHELRHLLDLVPVVPRVRRPVYDAPNKGQDFCRESVALALPSGRGDDDPPATTLHANPARKRDPL